MEDDNSLRLRVKGRLTEIEGEGWKMITVLARLRVKGGR